MWYDFPHFKYIEWREDPVLCWEFFPWLRPAPSQRGTAPPTSSPLPPLNVFKMWYDFPLEKEMAPHSSTLAWKIPWTEEPGGLQSTGSLRVGHDWATSLSLFTFMHWRRKWQRTPVFLPGESQGPGSIYGVTQSRTRLKWLSSSSTRFGIAFLPRSKCLLISWLQSPSAVILEPPKIVSHYFHCFPIYLLWNDGTGCHDLSVLNVEF